MRHSMSSQITALMVSFLIHLQSENQLTLTDAQRMLNTPRDHQLLIFKWMDFRSWDLYVYMREALEQFIHLEQQAKVKSYAKSLTQKEIHG